ncbi:hypothetical protein Trydic_g21253 [Trypoxylus dichotomus]
MPPVLTHGAETLTLTKKTTNKIRIAQTAMERSMLELSVKDKVPNTEVRNRTKVTDAIEEITTWTWSWAGHIARLNYDRWINKIIDWRPREDCIQEQRLSSKQMA